MQKSFQIVSLVFIFSSTIVLADPIWWTDPNHGILNGDPPAPDAAASQGQAKHVVAQAKKYLDQALAPLGGGGPEISQMIDSSWFSDTSTNKHAVKQSQIKYLAKPFYDRLNRVGMSTTGKHPNEPNGIYPWTDGDNTDDLNDGLVSLSQLKFAFSFEANPSVIPLANELPFHDFMESYPTGDLTLNQTNWLVSEGTYEITEIDSAEGRHSLVIEKTNPNIEANLYHLFSGTENEDIVKFSISIKPALHTESEPPLIESDSAVAFYFGNDSKLRVHDGSQPEGSEWLILNHLPSINPQQWQNIDVVLNYAEQRWSITLNDQHGACGLGFANTVTHLQRLTIKHDSDNAAQIDNIYIRGTDETIQTPSNLRVTSYSAINVQSPVSVSLAWDYTGNEATGFNVLRDGNIITSLASSERNYVDNSSSLIFEGNYDYSIEAVTSNCSLLPLLSQTLNITTLENTDGNDALPDVWELAEFMNLGEINTGDPDLDGLTNYDEFLRGSDPNDNLSPSNSLALHVASQVDDRLPSVVDLALQWPIFHNYIPATFVCKETRGVDCEFLRNQNCWIVDNPIGAIDLSGTCAYLQVGQPNKDVLTLISPRHVVYAVHEADGIKPPPHNHYRNRNVVFVDINNNSHYRTFKDYRIVSGDLAIGVLNQDVPNSIKYHKVLPLNWSDYLWEEAGVPILTLDQEGFALLHEINHFVDYAVYRTPQNSERLDFYDTLIPGDSGNPAYLIVNNEAVFLSAHHYSKSGPFITHFYEQVNLAMISLDEQVHPGSPPYQLENIDLSMFPAK